MKKLVLIFIMITFLIPSAVWAEKVVFVGSGALPPYVYEENQKLKGINVDVLHEACKRLNIEPEFQIMPAKRYLRDLQEGTADAAVSLTRTKEREEFLAYSAEPINSIRNIIIARKQSNIHVSRPDDLKGKSIGVVSAYSYGPEFDACQDIKRVVCKDTEEMLRILQKERIELAATQDIVYSYIGKSMGYDNAFKVIHVIGERDFYPVFSKAGGKNGIMLAEKFGAVIRQLKEEGAIRKITESYLAK